VLTTRRALCAALAAAAIAVPPAGARPIDEGDNTRRYAPTVTRVIEADGFDWGSAAIGAGAATAVVLLARAVIAPRPARPARR
jgi:hypothetical protein